MVVPNTTPDVELPKPKPEPEPAPGGRKRPGLIRRLIGRAARAYGRGRENAARRGGRVPLRRTPRSRR